MKFYKELMRKKINHVMDILFFPPQKLLIRKTELSYSAQNVQS